MPRHPPNQHDVAPVTIEFRHYFLDIAVPHHKLATTEKPTLKHELPDNALRLQRVDAAGMLRAKHADGRTRLDVLRQDGSAKIRIPRSPDGPLEAVLINTAGGLTGGDRLSWRLEAGPGAHVVATTQACEKAYRSAHGEARVGCAIAVSRDASVAWMPQETIFYEGSALSRTLDADLVPGARLLAVEASVFGRLAHGETIQRLRFRDRWRIRRDGRLVHAEDFAIGPEAGSQLAAAPVTGGGTAMATVVLVADDATGHLDAARAIVGELGGASAMEIAGTGKLLARLVAGTGFELRKRLVPLLGLLNGQAGLPKVWSI